jgi:hypothetical protein
MEYLHILTYELINWNTVKVRCSSFNKVSSYVMMAMYGRNTQQRRGVTENKVAFETWMCVCVYMYIYMIMRYSARVQITGGPDETRAWHNPIMNPSPCLMSTDRPVCMSRCNEIRQTDDLKGSWRMDLFPINLISPCGGKLEHEGVSIISETSASICIIVVVAWYNVRW